MADVKVTDKLEKLPISESDLHKLHRFAVAKGGTPVLLALNDDGFVAVIHPGLERTFAVGTQDLFAVTAKEAQLTITAL